MAFATCKPVFHTRPGVTTLATIARPPPAASSARPPCRTSIVHNTVCSAHSVTSTTTNNNNNHASPTFLSVPVSSLTSTAPSSSSPPVTSPVSSSSAVAVPFDPALMDSVHERTERIRDEPVAFVVLGASGDLAKKKTFPAIFSLFYHDLLPHDFVLYGFARSNMSNDDFRTLILGTLSCRVIDGAKCAAKMDEFLPKCFYCRGDYGNPDSFAALDRTIAQEFEASHAVSNRLFYLAVPPSVFYQSARCVDASARATKGWTRVVVEKPFGRDADSYRTLRNQLASVLDESETYRIDHFLAKVLIQNLMTLRFANAIFEPLWNRHHVKSVQIVFKEHFGVEGRAGYFNDIGIIRDIMQNHLLQIMALLAMEPPVSLHAEDIRDEKVKLLRAIAPLRAQDFSIGQYGPKDASSPGYLDDPDVPDDSRTPTFAACVMRINNARWEGVPFLMKAGKALDERKTEIRIQFKKAPGGLFQHRSTGAENNELVIRVQPDEAIYLRIVSKVPGLTSRMEEARLNLFYHHAWEESKDIPDAYERLILDVIQGEKSLFIRDDELKIAWDIFTPALQELESDSSYKPVTYAYGSKGPVESGYLASHHGVEWSE